MIRLLICCFVGFGFSIPALQAADARGPGIWYYNQIFGQLHQKAHPYSPIQATVACGQSLTLQEEKGAEVPEWKKFKVGQRAGYLTEKAISSSRPTCFQDSYPLFFSSLELDLTDMYFWGRLYDHYIQVKTEVGSP